MLPSFKWRHGLPCRARNNQDQAVAVVKHVITQIVMKLSQIYVNIYLQGDLMFNRSLGVKTMKKETAAALLYSATALAFIGMVEPASAQTIPMPPYPGDPSAGNSVQTVATVAACGSVGVNGFLGLPSVVGQGGIGVGVALEYGPPINGTFQGHNYVAACLFPTSLAQCNDDITLATSAVQSIAEAYSGLHFNGVSYWVQGQMQPPVAEYCTAKFGGGTGGTGGTGGQWVLKNRGTTYLDLDTPNGTIYKEDSYTNSVTCQADRNALIALCQATKGCNGNMANESVCQGG